MANRTEDGFDKTHLSIGAALKMGNIHRDYITHCFRWSFAIDKIMKKNKGSDNHILDFGCGKDLPLLNSIYGSRAWGALGTYTGVDLNKVTPPSNRVSTIEKEHINIMGNTNILDVRKEDVGRVNLVTSFEVFEHCPPESIVPILKHLHSLADDDAIFVYSTPVFNGKAAKNHINEMSRDMFGYLLEQSGYIIEKNYGTFASQADYKQHLKPHELEIYERLNEYHCAEVVANIFAPLYPEYSRNNLWVCRKTTDWRDEVLYRFPTPGDEPRAQHNFWED